MPRRVIAVVGVEILVLGGDEGLLHQIGNILGRHEQPPFLGEFVDDLAFAGIDPADRRRACIAPGSRGWASRGNTCRKSPPTVSAAKISPSVTDGEDGPEEHDPMNRSTH